MSGDTAAHRAFAMFDELLDVPEVERHAWIDSRCGSDHALARELRALLSASARPLGILDVSPGIDAMPDMIETVRTAFASGYDIIRELGRGGMATVFLARERKHDRDVVIKVLDPAISHLFGAERFLREVRIAASHAHPHIVPLIDSGDADGYLYYVMPWMGGETLRARLERGQVSVTEGIGILRDVAGALAFAHGLGVVHRDLKPENVLLTAGHAYLLDFGIAKLLDDSPASMTITVPGFAVGTRRYMAPEQAFAAADVDARADIYAWGVLGVEIFATSPMPDREAASVAPAMLARRDDLPPEVVQLLLECVEPSPAARPASMTSVVDRLDGLSRLSRARPIVPGSRRRMTIGGLLALGAAGLAFAVFNKDGGTNTGLAEPVAVTIFRNETGDSSLSVVGRYAGDWVTDGLQRMGGVRVVPWAEALMASEHATITNAPLVQSLKDEARAGTVVTGTFYRLQDSLRLQAQLIDAESGRVVAVLEPVMVPLNRTEAGISQLRDRVMGAVATARDERVASLPGLTRNPPSFSAYQAYDEGMDHFVAQRYDSALANFREAAKRDPTFTTALLLGARAAWNAGVFVEAESLVKQARRGARDLGPYNESSLRYIEALLKGDGAMALAAIERAAAIAPNSRAGFDYAQSLLDAGYAKKALEQLKKMDPDRGEMRGWGSYWTQLAHASHILDDPEGAVAAAREMRRRHPDRRVALVLEARGLAAAGDTRGLDSALATWDSLPTNVYWSQGAAMVVAGEELQRRRSTEAEGRRYAERAVKWLANRLVATPNDRAHRYWMGTALYSLGRYEEARPYFESLAKDYPDRMRYRGLAALTAARRGDTTAVEKWFGAVAPRDTGEYLTYRARVAAVEGDVEKAVSLLTNAMDRGVDEYPWLRGASFRDFSVMVRDPRGRALLSGR